MQTYFELVSSRFGTNDEGISHFFKLLTMPCKNISSASLFAPTGISTFQVVPAHLTKPMWWKRRPAQVQVQNCIWLSSCSWYLSTKASATAVVTAVLATPPRDLVFFLNVYIILTGPLWINRLRLFFALMNLLGDRFWDLDFHNSSWCFF